MSVRTQHPRIKTPSTIRIPSTNDHMHQEQDQEQEDQQLQELEDFDPYKLRGTASHPAPKGVLRCTHRSIVPIIHT